MPDLGVACVSQTDANRGQQSTSAPVYKAIGGNEIFDFPASIPSADTRIGKPGRPPVAAGRLDQRDLAFRRADKNLPPEEPLDLDLFERGSVCLHAAGFQRQGVTASFRSWPN